MSLVHFLIRELLVFVVECHLADSRRNATYSSLNRFCSHPRICPLEDSCFRVEFDFCNFVHEALCSGS